MLALPLVAAYRASARFAPEPLHNRYSHFHRGWVAPDDSARRELNDVDVLPTPKRAAAQSVAINMTPAGAISLTSTDPAPKKSLGFWRDSACFVMLFASLVAVVLLGRAVIHFSPEEALETEFVSSVGGLTPACDSEPGLTPCARCCYEGSSHD